MQQSVKMKMFYESLTELSKELSVVNNSLDQKRDRLKKEIYDFNKSIQTKSVDKKLSKQNKELAILLEDTINLIKKSSNGWVGNFEELQEKEKFRSELENHFIIIIYGKVKAGKSSLGNFIAKHRLSKQNIEFFEYDNAGKKQNIKKLKELNSKDGFNTDILECTAEIQGFKLDGMAWIDTPGLGGMNEKVKGLAQEYIQSADYIIYPTSSDSVLQQDEQEQLKELFLQNKKVTICITKSDEKIEDECECGSEDGCSKCTGGLIEVLQNKSSVKRSEQESYVKKEILNIIKKNKESVLGDIFSISSHVATKAIETNDKKLLEESNIPKFYELMTKIVKEKALKLKSETPYNSLKSLIKNDIIGTSNQKKSIESIKIALNDIDKKISISLDRFKTLQVNANADIESEIENIMAEYYSKITKENSKKMFSKIDAELNERVAKIIQTNISEIFTNFDVALKNLSTSFGVSDFEIKDIYKEYEYTTKERNKKIGGGIFGLLGMLGTGIFLASNPAGWAVAAGTYIVTGTAASYVGSKVGEIAASKHTEKIKVGDNKDEVIHYYKSVRLDYYDKYAKNVYQQMQEMFFTPLKNISNSIRFDIDNFEKKLTNIL